MERPGLFFPLMLLFSAFLSVSFAVTVDGFEVAPGAKEDAADMVGSTLSDADYGGDEDEEDELIQMDPVTGRRLYSGFQIIRTHPRTDEDISVLRFLEKGNSLTH